MPTVETSLRISAPPDAVWSVVKNVEAYPDFMESVRTVRLAHGATSERRVCTWSVDLDGSILEWTEVDHIDEGARRISFEQVSGDLAVFVGVWEVVAEPDDFCTARLTVEFEIGIPLLADMLNPVACRALEENALAMLEAIDSTDWVTHSARPSGSDVV